MTSHCKICSGELLEPEPNLYALPTVTSDFRPWPAGRSVAECRECGVVQRVLLPDAAPSFGKVYADYAMFRHSGAATDQQCFGVHGTSEGRTQKILRFIEPKLAHPPRSILDIGSGSGAGLLALTGQFPTARIHGYEPNDRPEERLPNLPENVSIINRLPAKGTTYDFITLFHVLEHVEDVLELLDVVATLISPKGQLLIEIPYPACNPFDFVIADHVWHFSKQSVFSLLHKAGFTVTHIGNDLIKKELTVLASPGVSRAFTDGFSESWKLPEATAWLWQYKTFLDDLRKHEKKLAVYGTGPLGAWVGAILGDKVEAYVDDDPARVGTTFNGRPVLSPKDIGTTLPIVAAFPDYQARWIAGKNPQLNIVLFEDKEPISGGHKSAAGRSRSAG